METEMIDFKKCTIGIELGSTRIKAVLIDENYLPIASGDYEWENQLADGIWTYSLSDVHTGIQTCFAHLKEDVRNKFGVLLTEAGAIGISGMMHGYLPFDKGGRQLAEFNGGKCRHAGKTTAGEIVFGMWYDESFPDGFTVAKECIISTDKDAKNVLFTGRTMYEFMASPQIALERNNYLTLISDNSGSDLTKLKTGQTYYITFNDENYKTNGKHITKEFTLTSDNPEMSMNDRYVTLLPQMRQFAYGSGTL